MPTEESTFAEQYLSKLDTILDRHRYSNGGVPLKGRERRVTSPLPLSAARGPVTKHARPKLYGKRHARVSSEGELSSSTSSLTSSEEELEQRGRAHPQFVASARAGSTWKKDGHVPVTAGRQGTHGITSRHHSDTLDGREPSAAVLNSLHSINSQLGQLLNRVGGPGEGASVSNGSTHQLTGVGGGGGGQGGRGASVSNNSMHLVHTPLSVDEPLGMLTSTR